MKWFFLITYIFSISTHAEIKKIKIDPGIQIKFDDKNWNYQYIKILSNISPYIFESKSKNDIKVIVQKETHADNSGYKNQNLVQKKCLEADAFYKNSGNGSAKSMKIKNSDVCLIQITKSEKMSFQIIYPIQFNKSTYDLLSFSWQSKDLNSVEVVSSLVRENL